MAELMRSPDDLKRVRQELADVVGLTRKVEESDFEKLTYLRCWLPEGGPPPPPADPTAPPRDGGDAVVCGYQIPGGSRVMINAWAIGRDGSAWDDPDPFRPARFLCDGVPDFKGSNFEFIPFGSGRRSCPGMQLGLYALEVAVAHILHCFTWELPDGMKPAEMDMDNVFAAALPAVLRLMAGEMKSAWVIVLY